MKKVLCFVPWVVLCLALVWILSLRTNAASESNLTFTLNEDGESYSVTACNESASGDLVIPATYNGKPVTAIGASAFRDCESLTSVTIPDSVTSIGNRAFYYCITMEKVNIPRHLTSIGEYVFADCQALTGITIPEGIEYIGDYAFNYCKGLTDITLPGSLHSIGECAFSGCYSLTEIIIPSGIIGDWAFANCYILASVTIEDGVSSIGEGAFSCAYKLADLHISQSVHSIENGAFNYCNSLADVYYSGSRPQWDAVTIGSYNDLLHNATLHCSGSEQNMPGDSTEDDVITLFTYTIENEKVTIHICDVAASGELVIPNTIEGYPVTKIDDWAFECCNKLTSIVLKNGLTHIGSQAFNGCTSLSSISIPASVVSISTFAFDDCASLQDVYYEGTRKQWDALYDDKWNQALTNVTIHCTPWEVKDGGTLLLSENAVVTELVIATEQVIDLRGYTLTADSLVSFGQIVDTVGGGGLIVENLEITSNEWLPIQGESGCYRFYEHEAESLGIKNAENSAVFGFTLDFTDSTAYDLLAVSEDVRITVTLTVGEDSQTYVFSRELVAQYVALVKAYPTLRPYMKLTVTGMDILTEGTVVTVTPTITVVGGKMQMIVESMQYIA